MEAQIPEAILTELSRQSEEAGSGLRVEPGENQVTINGTVDLDALAFVIAGSLAGGP